MIGLCGVPCRSCRPDHPAQCSRIPVNGIATTHSLILSMPSCRKSRCGQTGADYSRLQFESSFSKRKKNHVWSSASPACSACEIVAACISPAHPSAGGRFESGPHFRYRGRVYSMPDSLYTWVYSQEECIRRERACGSDMGQRSHRIIAQTGWHSLTGSADNAVVLLYVASMPFRESIYLQNGNPLRRWAPAGYQSCRRDVFVCGTPYVYFCRPTFPVPTLLWLFHISCSFPRRNPAQKTIYIQLGSLNRLRDSKPLSLYQFGYHHRQCDAKACNHRLSCTP